METVVRGLTIRHAIPSSEVGRGVKVRPTEPSGTRVNSRQTVKRKGTSADGCKLGADWVGDKPKIEKLIAEGM